jgi:hypothetical protein
MLTQSEGVSRHFTRIPGFFIILRKISFLDDGSRLFFDLVHLWLRMTIFAAKKNLYPLGEGHHRQYDPRLVAQSTSCAWASIPPAVPQEG